MHTTASMHTQTYIVHTLMYINMHVHMRLHTLVCTRPARHTYYCLSVIRITVYVSPPLFPRTSVDGSLSGQSFYMLEDTIVCEADFLVS